MPKTILEQTGWKGFCPVEICQDPDILLAISDFDYNLKDLMFEKYCLARFGLIRATDPKHFELLCDTRTTKDIFFKYWRVSGEYAHENTKGHTHNDDHLEISWKIFRITKGRIQDCWEIYSCRR